MAIQVRLQTQGSQGPAPEGLTIHSPCRLGCSAAMQGNIIIIYGFHEEKTQLVLLRGH